MASKVLTYHESEVDFLQVSTGQWVIFGLVFYILRKITAQVPFGNKKKGKKKRVFRYWVFFQRSIL